MWLTEAASLFYDRFCPSGLYHVPPEGDHASYIAYINSLPVFPLPEAFGLHENADITKDLQQTEGMLDTLILTGGAGGGGGSGEETFH